MDDLRLSDRIDALARIEPTTLPLLSVYLNTDVNETGRTTHDLFLRKELRQRARTYGERSPDRESLDRDCERIEQYLTGELQPSTRGVALFACSGAGLFEAIQLKVPFSANIRVRHRRHHQHRGRAEPEDQALEGRRLVAGAFSATRRERAPPPCEG